MAYQYPYGNYTSGNTIQWVQGVNGAKAYPVAPNGTVLLMDSEASRFFIKSADASGFPLPLRIFDYTEQTGQKADDSDFVRKDEFDRFRSEIKELIGEKKPKKEEKDEQPV